MVMLLVASRLVSMYTVVVQNITVPCWKYCRNIQAYSIVGVQRKFKRVSSDYAAFNPTIAQQEQQSYICSPTRYTKFLMIEFYSSHMLARHVSDLTGPSSGTFVYKLYVQIWYVVIRELLDRSSR